MTNLRAVLKKQGGLKLIAQYFKSGVLPLAVAQFILLGKSKKALEILRLSTQLKIKRRLEKDCGKFVASYKPELVSEPLDHRRTNKVWVCWLQGMEDAPELVKTCYKSLQAHLKDREIILISEDNYKDYVRFPQHIQQKFDAGIISKTHFSDLLRLELLIQHGGTWIDATVFCSGGDIPDYMLNSDLFLFQKLKPGLDGHATCISNWFITSCTNHPVLLLTQALLYNYWDKYNYVMDYFIFHIFFQIAIETYPDEWNKVVPFSNSGPHILLLRMFEQYDENIWCSVKKMTAFHKLSYKYDRTFFQKDATYYRKVLSL